MPEAAMSPQVGVTRCSLTDLSVPAAPAARLELEAPEDTESSSGDTSPIGNSLLRQKRAWQRAALLPPVTVEDLENQAEHLQSSPLGASLLDRKRRHARRRQAGLADTTNEPTVVC